jgi:cytochrome c553
MKYAGFAVVAALVWSGLAAPAASARQSKPSPAAIEHFEKNVRPLLLDKCVSCHGPKTKRGGLRLDSREAILKGGDSGPALLPGQPEKSLILKAVRRQGDVKMPPKETLPAAAVESIRQWINLGAPWPAGAKIVKAGESEKRHWSFQPVRRPAVPAVKTPTAARTPIDRFLLAKLQEKELTLSPEADRRTLIRRLTLDLTGLPPTPEEVDSFLADSRPDAYERLVDRLLASPAYGERWGRHWLDVARYADTRGYVFTEERRFPYSYTYRDYVIRSFNEDLPYDRFLVQQLAADQLLLGADRRSLAAMGFLTLGRRFLNNIHDIIDDRIDVVSRGLMGLTVSCARCHDHKFDPIPTRDYYSLYGVFASSVEPAELPLIISPDQVGGLTAFNKELQKRQAAVDEFLRKSHEEMLPLFRARASAYLLAAAEPVRRGGGQSSGDFSRALLMRWRAYLAGAKKKHHPVLAPWLAFAALPKEEFAEKSAALAKSIAANADPNKPIPPLVAKAFEGAPPASLAEVAQRYENLFKEPDKAIRAVLEGPNAPTNVPLAEIERFLDRAQRNKLTPLRKRVEQWKATAPNAPPRAMVLNDAPSPTNPRVLVRGNPNNPGVEVPRQFLEVLAGEKRQPFRKGSGRLELARAIADKDNPLTARVMVNRLWQHHFGEGLVRTPGDFGLRGEAPTHPELLDWLATEFVESGWSVKKLHRLILLSSAYRQKSDDVEKAAAVDPENRLLWRMNRRRLEFEPLRDSLLAVSGHLNRTMFGQPVDVTAPPFSPRRSIYGFIDRQNLPGLFRTFDLASPDTTTPKRHSTTVPQQALFLMNSPFVIEQARAFAARADVAEMKNDRDRIDRMHRIAYGRPAEGEEIELGLKFVRAATAEGSAAPLSPWGQYAQVLLLANELAFVD